MRKYDREFKCNAVKLYLEGGRSLLQLSEALGVPPSTLEGWILAHKATGEQAFPGKGHRHPEDEVIHSLRKENERLRSERDILKKALAIFSSPLNSGMSL
jgi:transposase-like protein